MIFVFPRNPKTTLFPLVGRESFTRIILKTSHFVWSWTSRVFVSFKKLTSATWPPQKNQMGRGLQLEELSVSKLAATFRECFSFKPSSNPLFHRIVPLSSWRGPRKKKRSTTNIDHQVTIDHCLLLVIDHAFVMVYTPEKLARSLKKAKHRPKPSAFAFKMLVFGGILSAKLAYG